MSETETIVDPEAVRAEWIARLDSLMDEVQSVARSLGWVVERIDKPMKESPIGRYIAPALMMQRRFTQLILDPMTRFPVDVDGVVDLYRLPGLGNVARIISEGGRWKILRARTEEDPDDSGYDFASDPLDAAMIAELIERLGTHGE